MNAATELQTADQIASALGTTKKTTLDWYHAGIIPAEIAEGRVYRFDLTKVREALAERAKKGPAK